MNALSDCSIKVSQLCISICSCFLFYNLLIFNQVLSSFAKDPLKWLVHVHSKFQVIPLYSLSDRGRTFPFIITENRSHDFTKVE